MSDSPDWTDATSSLGEEWTTTRMTVKAHACCGHNFASLDGVRAIMTREGLAPGDIGRIHARVYRATAEICGNPDPKTPAEARFSLPYCAAVMALRGAIVPSDFSDDALADPATRAMAAKVSFEIDAEVDAAFPALRPASVEITTTAGQTHTHHQPTRKGDPDAPLTETEVVAKFHALADPVLGTAGARALADAVARIEHMPDVATLPLSGATAQAAE
jgi:2-methylcitrate dehydratase PrpD